MATVTEVTHTCDVCGGAKDVETRMFELDGKAYEIDLCRKDSNGLGRIAAKYIAKARKVTGRPRRRRGQRDRGARRHMRRATAARDDGGAAQVAAAGGAEARAADSGKTARAGRLPRQTADPVSVGAPRGLQQKSIYVYGILPADIEVTADMRGVGEPPGLLRVVRFDGLAALVSEIDVSGPPRSADDRRIYREILDATAVEVPVLPVRFGTLMASEEAVAEELLAAGHEEFTAALERLEGRAEFQVKGRYVKAAMLGEIVSQDKKAARLQDASHGQDPDAARQAALELDQLINEAVRAGRPRDMRALRQAVDRLCVACVARKPAHELDLGNIAFLADLTAEREVERVIEDLAREWEGRIDIQLLGPMAAYDFAGTAQPGN